MKKLCFDVKKSFIAFAIATCILFSAMAGIFSLGKGSVFVYADDAQQNASAISSVSLTLEDSIAMNFFATVPADAAEDAKPSMEFTLATVDKTYTSSVDVYETQDGKWKFTYDGVTPQHMGDTVTAKLTYTTTEGTQNDTNVRTTSLKEVLTNYTKISAADMGISDAAYAKLQTLVADILTYGAESQKYVGYQTDALVTDGMTVTPSEFSAAELQDDYNLVNDGAEVSFYGAGLWFDYNLGIEVRFTLGTDVTAGALAMKATVDGNEETLSVAKTADGNYYYARMPLSVVEFASPVTFQVMNDGEAVGGELTYSVRTYVNNKYESATVGALSKAVWNYYSSAVAYKEAASVPADYRALELGQNATVNADPGVWYYHADGTQGEAYDFATDGAPSYQNGGVQVRLTKFESNGSSARYFRFRYQPGDADGTGLEVGDKYRITFTVETNVSGNLGCKAGGNISVTANEPKTVTRSTTVSASEAFYVSVSSLNFGDDKLPAEGLYIRISNITVETAENEENLSLGNMSTVKANPGIWYYNSSSNAKFGVAPYRNTETGELSVTAEGWGGDSFYFRYQPTEEEFANGVQFTVTFTVETDFDTEIRYGYEGGEKTHEPVQANTPTEFTITATRDADGLFFISVCGSNGSGAPAHVGGTFTVSNISFSPVAA